MSPYKVNTSYQRPTPQLGESDHGYSTMTPHETDNSENASITTSIRCGSIIGRDRYRPPGLYKQPASSVDLDGIAMVMPVLPPPPSNRRSNTPPTNGHSSGTTVVCVHKQPSIPEQSVLLDTSDQHTNSEQTSQENLLTTTVQVHAH